ncbi:hypothetical protein D3C72_1889770 [compost metagenome]
MREVLLGLAIGFRTMSVMRMSYKWNLTVENFIARNFAEKIRRVIAYNCTTPLPPCPPHELSYRLLAYHEPIGWHTIGVYVGIP